MKCGPTIVIGKVYVDRPRDQPPEFGQIAFGSSRAEVGRLIDSRFDDPATRVDLVTRFGQAIEGEGLGKPARELDAAHGITTRVEPWTPYGNAADASYGDEQRAGYA